MYFLILLVGITAGLVSASIIFLFRWQFPCQFFTFPAYSGILVCSVNVHAQISASGAQSHSSWISCEADILFPSHLCSKWPNFLAWPIGLLVQPQFWLFLPVVVVPLQLLFFSSVNRCRSSVSDLSWSSLAFSHSAINCFSSCAVFSHFIIFFRLKTLLVCLSLQSSHCKLC